MANTAIFVRSPYILSQAGVANDSIRCDLYLWNSPASIPSTPNRVVSKPIPSTIQTTVYFDISEFCRDFINPVSYTEVTAPTSVPVTDYCFCTAKVYKNGALQTTYTFICFDGYGYFADGQNPTYNDILLDEGTYQIKANANSGAITTNVDTTVNDWSIKYSPLSGVGTTYSQALTDIDSSPYIHENFKGTGGNIVEIVQVVSGVTSVIATYTFLETCEPKYTPINLDFINKYGAWQRLMLFKASYDTFDVSMTDYNMMSDTPNYNVLKGRKQVFNVNGNEKIKANTGWVSESYKEVIKQMMLSEIILIDNKPVKLSSKNAELHKSINKKMINYELSFEYAYMTINNVQ
jgi:hypothetical protein